MQHNHEREHHHLRLYLTTDSSRVVHGEAAYVSVFQLLVLATYPFCAPRQVAKCVLCKFISTHRCEHSAEAACIVIKTMPNYARFYARPTHLTEQLINLLRGDCLSRPEACRLTRGVGIISHPRKHVERFCEVQPPASLAS